MLKVLFFGQLKEVVKTDCLDIEWSEDGQAIHTVSLLRAFLQSKGDMWNEYMAFGKALVAVNQEMVCDDTQLNDNDEIAFFPPVTGG
jgi:molybdopterin synthase sulfur carrier subunit